MLFPIPFKSQERQDLIHTKQWQCLHWWGTGMWSWAAGLLSHQQICLTAYEKINWYLTEEVGDELMLHSWSSIILNSCHVSSTFAATYWFSIFGAARPVLTHSRQRTRQWIAWCYILWDSVVFWSACKTNKEEGDYYYTVGLTVTSSAKPAGLIAEIKPTWRQFLSWPSCAITSPCDALGIFS